MLRYRWGVKVGEYHMDRSLKGTNKLKNTYKYTVSHKMLWWQQQHEVFRNMAGKIDPSPCCRWLRTLWRGAGGGSGHRDCTPSAGRSSRSASAHCRDTQSGVEGHRGLISLQEKHWPQIWLVPTWWERRARSACLESVCWSRRCRGRRPPWWSTLRSVHQKDREIQHLP